MRQGLPNREERPASFIRSESYRDAQLNVKTGNVATGENPATNTVQPIQFRVGDRIIDTKDNLRATVLFVGEVRGTLGHLN